MNPKCIPYRGVYADPSSALYKALKEGNHKLAERLHKEAEARDAALKERYRDRP